MIGSVSLIVLVPVGLLVGLLIGAVGIGGVLLVPSLTYIGGISVHAAIPACMASYMVSGLIGATIYARRGSIQWRIALWVCAGAIPGAYVGALVITLLPSMALESLIAVLVVFAGVDALRERSRESPCTPPPANSLLFLIGAITGSGSAMSGTGGPLILIPILMSMKLPILAAVGLSQIIQVPISALATIGNVIHAEVDFALGLGIAVVMVLGVFIGAKLAHSVSALLLRRAVSAVLVTAGLGILVRLGYAALSMA